MRSFSPPAKILILHPGALGDGLLSLPTIRKLRRLNPRHKVIWYGHQGLGKVLLTAGEVDAAHSFESFYSGNPWGMGSLRGLPVWPQCPDNDLVIAWMNDDDGFWTSYAAQLGYTQSFFRSPKDFSISSRHMVERYAEAIASLSGLGGPFIPEDLRVLQLPKGNHTELFGSLWSNSPSPELFILLHPGSGSGQKCVSTKNFSTFARVLLRKFPGKVGFIGGPADSTFLDPILSSLSDLDPPVFQHLDLVTVCRLFNCVRLYIGHDSGLSHLAAGCGTHSLLLFGPTDPEVWAPRGTHVRICREQELNFSSEGLVELVEELLPEQLGSLVV